MKPIAVLLCVVSALAASATRARSQPPQSFIEIHADSLEDKLRGGMLAQILGNLNGIPHEFKYIDEPGNVERYTPSLPKGARTDDDTDIEWVYLRDMARSGEVFLPPDRITALWKRHINQKIWCANRYARDLMDLGFEPPWTGNVGLNPWSEFNISGQFVCESFGLMAPAMPQTAAKIGLNYTHVTIDGEPAQATQLFTTMIATSFVGTDLEKILDAGLAAVDPKSDIAEVVMEVRKLHRKNPNDWRATRLAVKTRWQTKGGIVRERNGYELNTASTIAALLYGRKDFVETLRIAFNFGWDADNNAATAATIIGVMKGRRWMNEQGWDIQDVYRNTTRDDMPMDETLTGLEDTLIQCARLTIERNGGELTPSPPRGRAGEGSSPPSPSGRGQGEGALSIYRIPIEPPKIIEPLATQTDQLARLRQQFSPALRENLSKRGITRARAAYIAICLGESDRLKRESPAAWSAAVAELEKFPAVVNDLFKSPEPAGDELRRAAQRAGLQPVTE